jgi:hypothetical protein
VIGIRVAAIAAAVLLAATPIGPYDSALHPTSTAPGARGSARLFSAASPFGVAVTEDGRARYDIRVTAGRLPPPDRVGRYAAYVAWAATPDLSEWVRLGAVRNGTSVVGPVALNTYLHVNTAEADSTAAGHSGPTVLHGTSPSGWLQSFLTHPLFRGIAQ